MPLPSLLAKIAPWKTVGKQIWDWRGLWITAPMVAGFVIAVRFTGLLQTFEWAILDEFFRRRPPEPTDSAILIVGIGEGDIRTLQQWPISDAVLAEALTKIKQHQPSAIGLDLYRDLPVGTGYEALAQIFQSTPNLIGIEKAIGNRDDPPIAPPPALKKLDQVASNDIVPDADGKIRRGLLVLETDNGEVMESLGLRLALFYLHNQGVNPDPEAPYLKLGQTTFVPFRANDGPYVRADDGGQQILLNYRGSARSFQTVSLSDLLAGTVSPDLIRDRIVLIGATASSSNDFFYTPYSSGWSNTPERMAGVEIQATIASQIIHSTLSGRPLIRVWAEPLESIWILLWAGIGAAAGWAGRNTRWTPLMMLVAVGGLGIGCFLVFLQGWWIPVLPPAMGMMISIVAVTRYIADIERKDRQIVMNLFGRHVTPEVADAIWRDRHQILTAGRVEGQQITATVMFTDIKDFSRIAEQTEPKALMVWLNEYMEAMTQLVLEHGGIVDKFIGDSVMAIFGVPIPSTTEAAIARDAQNAVRCSIAMAARLDSLNQQWQANNRPTVRIRIGISTGTVVIGSVGSAQRLDYTTIGDSVNVASRLESYDKSSEPNPCRILVNETTYSLTQGCCQAHLIGSVTLRGREQPVKVYQILLSPDPVDKSKDQ